MNHVADDEESLAQDPVTATNSRATKSRLNQPIRNSTSGHPVKEHCHLEVCAVIVELTTGTPSPRFDDADDDQH